MKSFLAGLLFTTALCAGVVNAQTSPSQCVTNAVAGGTADAITVPLLPCGLSTNILILTISANNTTTTPTLQMAGFPALPIYTNTLAAPGIGDFGGAGSVLMLASTGSSWLIINGNVGGYIPLPLSVANGGTGDATLTSHGVLYGNGTSAVGVTAAGTTGQFLSGATGSAPGWSTISSSLVSSLSLGTTGLTPNSATTGAIVVAGTLVTGNGGTGLTGYTTGDLLYASGASTLSKLAAGTSVQLLHSGTTPSWSAVSLTADVTGTLAVGNGGSGAATFTANGVLYGNTTSAFGVTGAGTTGTYLKGNTGSAPTFGTLASDTVTTIGFGTTGLTPSAATAGVVTVAGTLVAGNGGTGRAILTANSILYGNGTGTVGLVTPGLTGEILVGVTGSAPVFTSVPASGVSTIGFGTTGLTPSAATGGIVTVAGTLAVANGGTGQTSYTNGQLLIGNTTGNTLTKTTLTAGTNISITNGTGSITIDSTASGTVNSGTAGQLTYYAGTGTAVSGNANANIATGALTLGQLNSILGTLSLDGSTSGVVLIQPQAAAGSWNFNLPISAGTSGQPLLSGGGGATAQTYGTLGVAAGGTGQTSYTDGQLLIGNTTGNTLAKTTLTAGTGITITNGSGTISIASSAAAGNTPVTKTSNFNVTAGTANNPSIYCVDTTGGAVTATLDAAPANGATVLFLDCKQQFATANLILGRNSLTIMNSATNLTVSTNNANFHATYVSDAGTTTWVIW